MIVDVFDVSVYNVAHSVIWGYGDACFFGHGSGPNGTDYVAPIRGQINFFAEPRPWAVHEEGYFDAKGRPILFLEHAPYKKADAALIFLNLNSGVNGVASDFKVLEGQENVRLLGYASRRLRWKKVERQPILILKGPAVFQWERNGRLYRGEKSLTILKLTPSFEQNETILFNY